MTPGARNFAIFLTVCLSTLIADGALRGEVALADSPPPPYAAGEVLVGFRPGTSAAARNAAVAAVRGRSLQRLGTSHEVASGTEVVDHLATSMTVGSAIEALQSNPHVLFVEPNYLLRHTATSNDSYYSSGSLWGMYGDDVPTAGGAGTTNVYGSDAESAWAQGYTGSSSVYVGVIDEGIQIDHPDLVDNIWVNPFDPVDGIDNDGNGYVDDRNGWDFYNRDSTVFDPVDGDAHGTHVSGTIGARGGNGSGVAGVVWDVKLISAKFLGPSGGYTSDAISAINYLRDLKTRHGLNIVAASNSWGGGGYSSSLHTAILRAAKQGIIFVAAAGNAGTNNDTTPSYPSSYSTLQGTTLESAASYEAVISVAAISSSGARASFSNYGASSVDLGAPGVSIISSVPTSSYASYSGTSMATPHVSGAVALYAAVYPSASAAQTRAAILDSALPTTSLAGVTVTGGRLNVKRMLTFAPPPPGELVYDIAVTGISASSSVRAGKTVAVSIAVKNEGNTSQTFTVALSASGGTPGASKTISLAAGVSTTTSISWTAPRTRGTYTLTGRVDPVAGEVDVSDNAASRSIVVQ